MPPPPGSGHRHRARSSLPVGRQEGQSVELSYPNSSPVIIVAPATLAAPGKDGVLFPHRTMDQVSFEVPPVVPTAVSTSKGQPSPPQGSGPENGAHVPSLVDDITSQQRRHLLGAQPIGDHHGRQSTGLGGSFREPHSAGSLEPRRSITQHQLVGTESGALSSAQFPASTEQPSRSNPNRQCVYKSTHKPSRGNTVSEADDRDTQVDRLGREPSTLVEGSTHFRNTQHTSRLSKQSGSRPCRMGVASRHFQPTRVSLRTHDSGFVCHLPQCQAPKVLLPLSIPGVGTGGRVEGSMAARSPLRLPSPPPDSQGTQESEGGAGTPSFNCPLLAEETMVRRASQSLNQGSLASSSGSGSTISGSFNTPRSRMAQPNRLEVERLNLHTRQVSNRVIDTIQASRRPSTTRIYQVTWQTFSLWCENLSIEPTLASIPQLLEFLQAGLDKGLKPNTLRRQVSAIASVVNCGSEVPLAKHPLISRFLRGATNISPPVIHRYPTWDLPKVLQTLAKDPFEPITTTSLKLLSWKTAFLVAITSARRISEISALSVREDLCHFYSDRVILRLDPSFLPKVNTTFHRAEEVILPTFSPELNDLQEDVQNSLDVSRALQTYIHKTRPIRRTEALFVQFQQKALGKKASSATIGRWLRASISLAYEIQGLPVPRGITAHSTRGAATTTAWATRVPIEQICKAATWSSPSAFIRHYRIDAYASADTAFGRSVLQSVHSTV